MARARDPNRDKAFELYKKNKGDITNRKLGEILGVPEKTISAWKSRDKWVQCSTAKNCSTTNRKRGGQPGNTNGTGPPRNKNAVKHGLMAKYLPPSVYEIVEEINTKSPLDILWENITLTHANLLHAQRILFVENKEDTSEFVTGIGAAATTMEIHASWDKQTKALKAIASTQATLRNMIRAYDELSRSDLVTEEQRLRMDILKTKLTSTENTENKLSEYFDKLGDEIDGSN